MLSIGDMKKTLALAALLGAAAAATAAPAPGVGLVQQGSPLTAEPLTNYGIDVPTRQALRALAPKGWRTFVHKSAVLPPSMAWTVGEQWTDVLGKFAVASGLSVLIDWNEQMVLVRPAETALAEAGSAAGPEAKTPLPAFSKGDSAERTPLPRFDIPAANAGVQVAAVAEPQKVQPIAPAAAVAPETVAIEKASAAALPVEPVVSAVPSALGTVAPVEQPKEAVEMVTVQVATATPTDAPPLVNSQASEVASTAGFLGGPKPEGRAAPGLVSAEAPADVKAIPPERETVAEAVTAGPASPTPVKAASQELVEPNTEKVEPAVVAAASPDAPVAAAAVAAGAAAAELAPVVQAKPLPEAKPSIEESSAEELKVVKVETKVVEPVPPKAVVPVISLPTVSEPLIAQPAPEPARGFEVSKDGVITATGPMEALVAATTVQPTAAPVMVEPSPAATAALEAFFKAPVMESPVIPSVPVFAVNPSPEMVESRKEASKVEPPKSTGDFSYTKAVALSKPLVQTVAQGIANRFDLRLVWVAPDIRLQGPITLLSQSVEQDVELLRKALGRFSPVTVEVQAGELRVTSKDPLFVAQHRERAAQLAREQAMEQARAEAAAAAGGVPNGEPGKAGTTGNAGYVAQGAQPGVNGQAQAAKAPAATYKFQMVVEAGHSLEQALRTLLRERGYTHEWRVDGGFEASRQMVYQANTVTELLSQVLPPLGISADIYTVDNHIVVRPGDSRD